jgi:hypothetical protein
MAKWFREQPEKFYTDGFKKLVQRWWHRIKHERDYVQTWGTETKYAIWAIFCALFHFDSHKGKLPFTGHFFVVTDHNPLRKYGSKPEEDTQK